MPRPRPRTAAPKIAALELGELTDGEPGADFRSGADLESVRYGRCALGRVELVDARLSAVELDGVTADEVDLRGARLVEVDARQVGFPVVRAARSQWRETRISGRLGSLEAYESQWRSVHFTGCKLSFVNLRGAELTDVLFTDCLVEELDLVGAEATRVRFAGSRVGRLDVQDARLRDVDLRGAELETIDTVSALRGATITPVQLSLLAPVLASGLGISVED